MSTATWRKKNQHLALTIFNRQALLFYGFGMAVENRRHFLPSRN
jgi:hypothetical protein